MRRLALAALALPLMGCATGERLNAQGEVEHQIVCGYLLPWSTCESRAESLCPTGFTVVSKEWDAMSGSEMYVRCKG
jgi:hypothetical protein